MSVTANPYEVLDADRGTDDLDATPLRCLRKQTNAKPVKRRPWSPTKKDTSSDLGLCFVALVLLATALVPGPPPARPAEPGIVFVRPVPESYVGDTSLEWRFAPHLANQLTNATARVRVYVDGVSIVANGDVDFGDVKDDLTLAVDMGSLAQGLHNATVEIAVNNDTFTNTSLFVALAQ